MAVIIQSSNWSKKYISLYDKTRSESQKTLQYIMGHADISVTLNVYTHVQFDDAQAEML